MAVLLGTWRSMRIIGMERVKESRHGSLKANLYVSTFTSRLQSLGTGAVSMSGKSPMV